MIANPTGRPLAVRALPNPDLMSAIAAEPGARDGVPVDLVRLRRKFPRMSKTSFDRGILALADQGLLWLVTHDHGPALPEAQQKELVSDPKGKDYHGRPALYVAAQMRNPAEVTDRALRYRARRNAPPSPRLCAYCGARNPRDLDHVDGREENTSAANLVPACRRCNTIKGATFAKLEIGRLTRQYNPALAARTLAAWLRSARQVLTGTSKRAVQEAVATIQATTPDSRSRFARELARRRPNPDPTFAEYLEAVKTHRPGAHDDGGATIHRTSPAKRSEYAVRIADIKRRHGTNRRTQEVPF